MTLEQLNRAKVVQSCIESEKRNIEHMKSLGECKELVIMSNNEEVQRAIKGMYYSCTEPAPRYATGDDIKILVEALNKPKHENIDKLQNEFEKL